MKVRILDEAEQDLVDGYQFTFKPPSFSNQTNPASVSKCVKNIFVEFPKQYGTSWHFVALRDVSQCCIFGSSDCPALNIEIAGYITATFKQKECAMQKKVRKSQIGHRAQQHQGRRVVLEIMDRMLAKKENLMLLRKALTAVIQKKPNLFIKRILMPYLQRDERLLEGEGRVNDGVVLWRSQGDGNIDRRKDHDA